MSGKPSVTIDKAVFYERLNKLAAHAKANKELYGGADAFVLVAGADEGDPYDLGVLMGPWLTGYEFPKTALVLSVSKSELHVFTGKTGVRVLSQLLEAVPADSSVALKLHERSKKDVAANKAALGAIKAALGEGAVLGHSPRDQSDAFVELVKGVLVPTADAAAGVHELWSVLAADEVQRMRTSAKLSGVMLDKFVKRMESIVDRQLVVKHKELQNYVVDEVTNLDGYDEEDIEEAYLPIVQSGSLIMRKSRESNGKTLHYGVIVYSAGARFQRYCTSLQRTFVINPTQRHEDVYNILLSAHAEAVDALRDGAKLSDVVARVHAHVRGKDATLAAHLLPDLGHSMHQVYRDGRYAIKAGTSAVAHAGQVFALTVGVQGVADPHARDNEGKTFGMWVGDSVLVRGAGEGAEVLTAHEDKQWASVTYTIDDAAEAAGASAALELKMKAEGDKQERREQSGTTAEEKRSRHQAELARRMREEGAQRFSAKGKELTEKRMRAYDRTRTASAYQDASYFPTNATDRRVLVDDKSNAVLVPLHGAVVPFHISTVKSVNLSDAGLRINFYTPGQSFGRSVGPELGGPKMIHLKELSVRSTDVEHLQKVEFSIKNLRKRWNALLNELKDKADIIKQDELILSNKAPRLMDVTVRPNITGRKSNGTLEIHKNGVRFKSFKGERVDIIFDNIKHCIFQRAVKDVIVLLHFHLRFPIMVGKKKTKDIQFYTEVMEASYAVDNANRSAIDPDELEEEQRQREMTAKLNRTFEEFHKKLPIEVDEPLHGLGFTGNPGKSTVLVLPTTDCLVHLVEFPWFVVTLSDIEIVHFERVSFSLRNFDMVIVYKDYSKAVSHINAIPINSIDTIKEWLDEINIKYYAGPASLNWTKIMATVRSNPKKFFDDGGWDFLSLDSSSEEEDEESDAADEFVPSGSESEDDDDYSSDDYSEEEEDAASEDEFSEEGLDWDELEQVARKDDAKRNFDDTPRGGRKRGAGGAPPQPVKKRRR